MDIEGASIAVAGGASGLGLAAAKKLAGGGAKVAVIDIAEETQARARLGNSTPYFHSDIRNETAMAEAFAGIRAVHGSISALVNAAGKAAPFKRTFSRNGPFALDVFQEIVDINLVGAFNCARLAAQEMADNAPRARGERGVIINVSSINASDAPLGTVAYTAAKAGVEGMTLAMARDLSQFGIRVCTIAPGSFDTPMLDEAFNGSTDSLLETVPFPNDRLGDPADFASLVEQICVNPMLNGAVFRIDGAARLS
ncbi:MAG: SDR family NAD(P)-dependent oxidoreductase [Pseudomonadota bacterium]